MSAGPGVSAAAIAAAGCGFEELHTDGAAVYWVETRPAQDRCVLVTAGGDAIGAPWSVGSRVHEYGGAAVAVREGVVYFVNEPDQRIYRQAPGGAPAALTPDDARRYGDLEVDAHRNRLFAVCEDHRGDRPRPDNLLVVVPLGGGEPEPVVAGNDFYQAPRLAPDGARLAWVAWDLPRMPWDATGLYVAELDGRGRAGAATLVAGGPRESVCHPRWSPDGVLYFVSDRTGWWNLYAWDGGRVRPVTPMSSDVGRASALGHEPFDVSADAVVATVRTLGRDRLARVDRATGTVEMLWSPSWEVSQPRLAGDRIVFLGGSPTSPVGVWQWDRRGGRSLRSGGGAEVEPALLAEPECLRVPTRDGATTHAFHYRPRPDPAGGGPPPLIVIAHGGPVNAARPALALGEDALMAPVYWTSRGYAVLDVNYRGSTGYGRAYREALHGRWGEVDVDDCIDAARFLIERGAADGARVVLRGWSAGGFTTLAALAFRDFFAAGASYFPVADLEAVHLATHKYEAGYDHLLVGDWATERTRYRERSPVNGAAGVTAPVLVLQGLDDPICPAGQTGRMVRRLRELGRDVEYLTFEGEGHGFRRAASIIRSLETEAAFYARVLPGGGDPPVVVRPHQVPRRASE